MTRLTRLLALGAALLLPALAQGQGIRDTAHDLSTSAAGDPATRVEATVSNEICIFCHTPHNAQSTQLVWNHTMSNITAVSWGNDMDGNPLTSTTEGTTLPDGSPNLRTASRRCLACHDGSIAIGDVTNPASPLDVDAPAGRLDGDDSLAPGNVNQIADNDGAGNLDMAGNHPISIPYAGETAYNTLDSGATADGAIGNYYQTETVGCTSPSGVCTTAPATDGRDGLAINLLPNTVGAVTNVGIECGSCHEPHNRYGFSPFLRVDNSNASGLCRSCHNK